MKSSLLILVLLVACAKESTSSRRQSKIIPVTPDPIEDVTDPLVPGDQQQQTDGEFTLERTYNGTNVVLNYNSRQQLGMIRIKDKDASKLHKHMALSTIKVQSPHVKTDLEAKVGKHVNCREDACWIYIDYKNGEVRENEKTSEAAKAPRIILTYKGDNLKLQMLGRKGRIFFEGMDAKALYSVMEVREDEQSSKAGSFTKKAGKDIKCSRLTKDDPQAKPEFKCELVFNHRTGSLKESAE